MIQTSLWQFWIDRGGTFTDIVAKTPEGQLISHKLLSENPQHYADAALQGMRDILQLPTDAPFPTAQIDCIKMGTTVATNALLERKGEPTALCITQGFKDALRIGYQNRPDLFALHIQLPPMLYSTVVEIAERVDAAGQVLHPLDLTQAETQLRELYQQGLRSLAIVLLHGYRYPDHEQQLAALAQRIGFPQISVSHQVSPLQKLVSRGDTTVVDAYLSPILRRYVQQLMQAIGDTRLFFMQSNGGLTAAESFQGKDSILSGPAGGIVGAVQTSAQAGFTKIINFDMGGTSTDVSHYAGEFEREFETQIAGVRLRVPMLRIHTVAAGGGSILHFDGARFQVGPDSAGARPGPACYRQGGRLTITDCNVMLGRLQPQFFPKVFGASGTEALDSVVVTQHFQALARNIATATGVERSLTDIASGFLSIAVDNMANAIKQISVQRGYAVQDYTLCCFGGAAGQHACLVAEALGMQTILCHPQAGVLSALGMGLADVRILREHAITQPLDAALMPQLTAILANLEQQGRAALAQQPLTATHIAVEYRLQLRYAGTDTPLTVKYGEWAELQQAFMQAHQRQFGFVREAVELVVETAIVEVIGQHALDLTPAASPPSASAYPTPLTTVSMVSKNVPAATPVYRRADLSVGFQLVGPALLVETTATTIVERGWTAEISDRLDLILRKQAEPAATRQRTVSQHMADPVQLEIFSNLFMSIAEQMGATLANTAYSVNIKERLDFSCAVFDAQGQLIANAPHVPVHLGSMGDSVAAVIESELPMQRGDVFMLNNPYRGGTHLPDVTVVTPVFIAGLEGLDDDRLHNHRETHSIAKLETETPQFYVASRGHHADIGGKTPGSMPADSTTLAEEGVVIDVCKLVTGGQLQTETVREILSCGMYPARNVEQNLADLRAQIAANATGVHALRAVVSQYGLATVQAYMGFVLDNAEQAVRQCLATLPEGDFCYPLDNGSVIQVRISVDKTARSAVLDFTGTSPQQANNFNAPLSVAKAAVLYVFRTLVNTAIPLNAGCLRPLTLQVPAGCLLNPHFPAAVVAGNVETSQAVTDALYGALGVLAGSQGTMNNLTFGNADYQYYETLCGGAGAGNGFAGASAVHTHMTNSRLTDPEVLEWRFPVLLEQFAIRVGSGGEGRYRGGDGVVRRLRFLQPMTATILSSHRTVPPQGLAGGAPGHVGENRVVRLAGQVEVLASTVSLTVAAGEMLEMMTPGGGGFGVKKGQKES